MTAERPMWMVRSAQGRLFEEFRSKGAVAIGWFDIGRIDPRASARETAARLAATGTPVSAGLYAGIAQLHRFASEVSVGDAVVTYSPSLRKYLVGIIESDWIYDGSIIESKLPNVRRVRWKGEVSRDALLAGTRNSLGSTLTLFQVPESSAADIRRALGRGEGGVPVEGEVEEQDEGALLQDVEARGLEFTKDRLNKLDWDEMQELVAGLLRAMGYKTRISPSGPDQGKDIIASPDGFGFEHPRIVVEVKHREQSMGSKEIRSFLGGRHKDDRGLYVSTGGFTKDAYYEAERASIPLTLMDLDDLVKALVENYERLDVEAKRLIPLKRLYWPA